MKIQLHHFEIRSLCPLLMHSDKGLPGYQTADDRAKTKTQRIPSREEEAELGAYRNKDGSLFLPSVMFHRALLNAGISRKIGKLPAWKAVNSSTFVVSDKVDLFTNETNGKPARPIRDYVIDLRSVVIQKARIVRARPMIESWSVDLPLNIDTDAMSPEILVDLFGIAGTISGVGSYRIEKKGPFGRFECTGFSVG